MAEDDWGSLMAASQNGDGVAYRALLGELQSWLRRYFARRLPHPAIEDAVQDTMLAIHEKRHTYDPGRPFGPWMASIARYKWIDRLRVMKASPLTELDDTLAVGDHEEAVTSANSLATLMADLKPAQAEVIRLVKLQGFSIEEAASRTGQSVSLVKVNIHRGLGKLAAIVRRDSGE